MLKFFEWIIVSSLVALVPIEFAAPQSVNNGISGHTSPVSSRAAEKSLKTIVFIGDSLTQGYGVKEEEAYPDQVGRLLEAKGFRVKIINGGISASVTADADRRVKWYLRAKPDIAVLALGANDGLKGTPPEVIKKNLSEAIDFATANGIKILLCGIKVFTNFGPDYGAAFAAVFSDLAKEKRVPFMPFLLEGVALNKDLMQADGKHPNAKGHEVVAKNVARQLESMLESDKDSLR